MSSVYIGKCKSRGCKSAMRASHPEVQQITHAEYTAGDFDPARAFSVHGVNVLARCAEHGNYLLRYLRGRLRDDVTCDARCTGATGPNCDCSCGGANHGANHHA